MKTHSGSSGIQPDWVGRLRQQAEAAFTAGVAAADPKRAVEAALGVEEGRLWLRRCDGSRRMADWRNVRLVAFGKAASSMAEAACALIPEQLIAQPGIVVTNYENFRQLEGCETIAAGHPLPDENGVRGGQSILAAAENADEGDLFLVLISGGGSALIPGPAEGLDLESKIKTTETLLACGADINQVNTVRKHLSRIKGGRLARSAVPADLHALILSDVLGDDLSAIASGPTVPDRTTFADSRDILQQCGAWEDLTHAVRKHIEDGVAGRVAETPKPGDPAFGTAEATLIGSNTVSLEAMEGAARDQGYHLERWCDCLKGEARAEAQKWVLTLADRLRSSSLPLAMSAGGETTVTLTGSGLGGRNQECALAFALAAEQNHLPERWVFLSGGTDGRDGPTDAAGGVVHPWTLRDMRRDGIDPEIALMNNDSYPALKSAGALLMTGATGTNVADLQIALTIP